MPDAIAECPKHGAFMASLGLCPICGDKAPKGKSQKKSVVKMTSLEKKFLAAWQRFGNGQELAMQYKVLSMRRKTPTFRWKHYKIDFSIPSIKLGIELQGGTHSNGGHTRGMGYHEDRARIRDLMLQGWTIIEFTTNDLNKANAHSAISEVMEFINFLQSPQN